MSIETSTEITELAKALSLAQAQIEGAEKGSLNPHFGKKYADLTSVWDACRGPLTKNGLSVVQQPVTDGDLIGVVTTLLHQSGQFMRSVLFMKPERPGAQAAGSAITYCRRFSLAAFVGVCPEDDDGEKAEDRDKSAKPPGASWGKRPANRQSDPADTGEPINAATLEDLRFKATAKFPKGRAARDWLKTITGIDDPAALSEFEAQRALKVLEAAA